MSESKKTFIERTRALAESKNWYQDRYQTMVVQRNILFFISILSLAVLFFAATALATLINKKTFEPFVIAVEENTGAVTNVNQQSMQTFAALDSVARYFIVQYIVARESYSPYTAKYNLQLVSNYSTETTLNLYNNELRKNSEQISTYNNQGVSKIVKVNNIFQIDKNNDLGDLMNIRITVTDFAKGVQKAESNFIILLRYKFLPDLPQSVELSYINPLNFRIFHYEKQQDVTSGEK